MKLKHDFRCPCFFNDHHLKREADPLLKAPDTIEIDNSDLISTVQFDIALGVVVKKLGGVTEAWKPRCQSFSSRAMMAIVRFM